MGIVIKGEFKMNGRKVRSTINDVSNFFLSRTEMSQKKLQKMCYYAYAWYLTLYDDFLFDDGKFEGWIHGPVNVSLYHKYKDYGWRDIPKKNINICLSQDIEQFLDVIFNTFNSYTGNQLESMTHAETPWLESRKGLAAEEPGHEQIRDETIINFYSNLREEGQVE